MKMQLCRVLSVYTDSETAVSTRGSSDDTRETDLWIFGTLLFHYFNAPVLRAPELGVIAAHRMGRAKSLVG
jgi:hypothetical protein